MSAIGSDIYQRKIERKVISDDEMRAKISARGTPTHVADILMGLYIAARNGEFATVDPALILGHRPMTIREVMALNRDG